MRVGSGRNTLRTLANEEPDTSVDTAPLTKLKPFRCQAWLFAAAMGRPIQDGSQGNKGPAGGEKTVCTDGGRQTADFTSTEAFGITCTLDQRCQIELDTPWRALALEPFNKTQRQ